MCTIQPQSILLSSGVELHFRDQPHDGECYSSTLMLHEGGRIWRIRFGPTGELFSVCTEGLPAAQAPASKGA